MLAKRIIACLDIKKDRVVKGTKFKGLVDVGDPVKLAKKYSDEGADEISFLDINASHENRSTTKLVKKVARQVFVPLSVGGGIKDIAQIKEILNSGAEKVSIGTSAVINQNLIEEASRKFGSQAIVVSIDAKKIDQDWYVYIKGGRINSGIKVIEFTKKVEILGAGEILLNSIDYDGTKKGFDIELTNMVCKNVNIPVIASGGAGKLSDFIELFKKTDVDAALAASIIHYDAYSIKEIKNYLKNNGVHVRC